MFSSIRNRLTLQYTAFTGIALLLFAVVFYTGLSSLLLREQEQETLALAVEQAALDYEYLEEFDDQDKKQERDKEKQRANQENRLVGDFAFYYVLTADNRIAARYELFPELGQAILASVRDWNKRTTAVFKGVLHNGQPARFMVAGTPVYDDGKLIGRVVVGKDLSRHDHVLARLIQALAVSSLVFILIAALAGHWAAKKALIPIKDAFAAQQQFVADASHELRTPLSVFQASLEVLERKEGATMAASSQQVLTDLRDEVRRMTRLVSDLLTLARADSGAMGIAKEEMNLALMAKQIVRSLTPLAEKKNITVHLILPEQAILHADKDRMAQLIVILLDNAIKFTADGGEVTLSLLCHDDRHKPGITIIVKDTGIGMAKAEVDQVFKRFYRADKARSRDEGGTGLGLPIAAWIVKAHGGVIDVASELGKGSTFTVQFPVK